MSDSTDDVQRPSIVGLLLGYPRQTALIVIFLLFAGLAEGFGVATLMPLISTVAGNDGEQTFLATKVFTVIRSVGLEPNLVTMLLIVVVGMILKATMVLLAMSQVGLAMAYVGKTVRLRLLKALMTADWSYFTLQPTGELTTALTTESSGAAAAFWGATKLTTVSIQVVIYLGLALAVSWQVTVAGLLAGGFLFLALGRLVGIARRAGREAVTAYNGLSRRLVDSLGGFRTIKVSAAEDRLGPMLEADNDLLYSAQRRLLVSKEALVALQEPIMVIFMALGLYAVSRFLNVPIEQLIMMAFLFQRTVTRIGQIQSSYQQIASSEAYYISIESKIRRAETARETHMGARVPQLEDAISIRHVYFAYGDRQVLRDVSVNVPANSLTLIHGPSGSGKSTLVDLITGLRSLDEGVIEIDGVPLRELDINLWRRQIGYVPQELFLFHESIRHNISLGDPMVGDDDVVFALEAAEATSFVSALPEGLDSTVGERGALLSGGQRQRLSIARALARRPSLLVLDEPTTALDPKTELEICRTLSKLEDITILAISHQAQLQQFANPIYHLIDGCIADDKDTLES